MELKQCLPHAVTIPTLEIATMERKLVSGVMVGNNCKFFAHDVMKYCSSYTSHNVGMQESFCHYNIHVSIIKF